MWGVNIFIPTEHALALCALHTVNKCAPRANEIILRMRVGADES